MRSLSGKTILLLLIFIIGATGYAVGEVLLSNSLASNPIAQKSIPGRLYIYLKTPFALLWPDREISLPELDAVVAPDIPYGAAPDDYIQLDSDELERGIQEAQAYHGVANWFRVLWREHTATPRLYWGTVNEPFFAIVEIASFTEDKDGWFLVCLLDYAKIPCSSEEEPSSYILDEALSSVTIETPPLSNGLHALSLILLADIGDRAVERWLIGEEVMNNPPYLIATDGDTSIPNISFINPTRTRGTFGVHLRMVDIHTNAYPLGSTGNFLADISFQSITEPIVVGPGERIDFYLHLNNPHKIGIDYAVMAIVDRKRVVPLYLDGEGYSPMYVHNKSRSWQTMEVSVFAPDDVGHHNLQLLSFPFPYASIESARAMDLDIGVGISQPGTLIDIDVSQAP